ncbi:MAG: LPD23 domain-containing protein [Anaerovibrio sp.]
MATPEAGERYAEYSELKDKDGNPLMSKKEAWHRALLGGSANAALEVMPTFGVLGNMLKGAPHASKVIGEIVTANTADMGTKAMAGTFAKKYGKNVLKIAGVEAGEEGTQAIADDLLMNNIKNTYGRAYTGKDGKLYYTGDALSAYDIVTDGLKASLQALPSSFIFGVAGGFTPVAGMAGRYAARARHLSALEKAHGELARQTYTGTVMAEQLQQAVHDSRLKDTAPDVQRKLIKEKAAGTGFETVYIDTELALEKENGQNDLEAVAKTIGLSQEDLQTAIDTKGTIAVPLECFAQSEASSEVLEAASFNPEAEPMARMQKNAQDVIRRMQELVEKAADHQIKMVDIISRELFPEETQQATVNRELVQAAIIENPENPALGLKTLIEKYRAQKMAILEPALKFLDDTSGNGTVIVPIDDEGHTVRLSENAKWYQDFWKEFGRKPTKAELIEIAEGMVTGKSNIEYWTITSEEEEQQAKDIMLDIAELNHKLQLLENIKPKMQGINGVEMRLTEGLSAEAYKVYRILNEQLKNAPGTASRAGRISAILFARHADIFAKAMRENGAADYTALDYLKQHQVVFNQDLNGGMNQDANNEIIKYPDNAAETSAKLFSQEAIPVEANIVVSEDKRVTEAAVNAFSEKYPSGIEVNTPIGKVTISRRGIRNSLNHKCYQAKMDSVLSLGEGVKNMTYIGSARDFDGKPITNHFFAYPIEYNNERRYVLCRIKHADSGRPSFYVHDVIPEKDIQKMSQSVKYAAHVDESTRDLRGSALYSYILTEFYRKGKEKNQNIFNQMAGERAATNLDMGQGVLLAKLREAQSMNATEEEIYKKTGWILGADGKWRFEIPDNLDAIDYGVLHENGEAMLSEVYDNPKLYMAYPQLQYIPVTMDNDMENSAGSTNGLRIRLAPKAGKTTLLHEIQHIIQRYENFASGGSPDTVINKIEDRLYSLKRAIEDSFKSDTGDAFGLLEDYDNAKQDMVRAMRSRKRSEAAQFKGIMQELKAKIAYSCRNPEDVDNVISAYCARKKLNDILTEYRNTPSDDRPAMRKELYRQLAGEQEAVATEKRALSTDGQAMPRPHGYDAVVVFDKKSMAFSTKNDTGGGFSIPKSSIHIPAEQLTVRGATFKGLIAEFSAMYPKGINITTAIGDVKISKKSIKDSLSHGFSQKKIAVIPTLEQGIKQAEHVLSLQDYDDNRKTNHFFVYTVNIGEEENFVLCRVIEQNNQRRLYVHEVASRKEIKKISDSLHARAAADKQEVPRGIALYASILSDYVAKVDNQFGEKAEIFNQGVRGQSAPLSTGGYIMSLLQTADESTFLHESGHLFLWDLEQLAGFGGQYAEDWRVVQEWTSYKKGAENLYKGTPFEKEFATLAQNIRAAEEAGDVNTADSLKRRWMHERFARGFEMYLKQGKAPSKSLQSVFRKFKQFLQTIYIAFAGEGVRANPTVERVMARMIASDDEIEAAELDDRFKDISKAGGEKLMGESPQETYQRWWQEAKEEAKEKLMKILMQDLEEEKLRLYDEAIVNERSRMRKELEQMPLYLAQKIISETGNKNAAVELGFYDSIEAYEAELNETPSLEQVLDDYMAEFAKEKDKEIIQAKVSEEKVAELIKQTHYHKKLMALETEIMKSKEEAVNKINAKARNAMDELDATIQSLPEDIDIQLEKKTDKNIKKVIDAINKLRFSTRWTPDELARIDDIIHSATKQEMLQALKEFTKQAGEWKKNLKAVQEAFNGRMKMMKKMAEQDLAGRSIAEACSYNTYVTREKKAAKLVDKMVRIGKWDVAMVQQEARFTSAALADAAKKNQEHVNKLLNTIEKQLKARTVKLPKEERYWHRQLAYLLHLIPDAPERPEDCPDLKDIFNGLNESLDIEFDIGKVYDIVTQESFTGYRSLTIAQLEEMVDMMTVLYKTGRDKFKMKSFDGMLISDVVDEILEDIHNNTGKLPSVETKAVMDDKGGIGYSDLLAKIPGFGESLSQLGQQYELSMLRPETLLKILGKSAHKYIMGLYDKAAVDEGRRMAEAIAELSKIMSVYSQKEKKEMKKKKYKLETGYGMEDFSKENILCMALNYGNEINWLRLCNGLGVEDGNYLRSFLDENMTKKDWLTVQALWDHIGKYWKDTVKVEQELNGVTLKGVEARGFWVTVDGEVLKLRGGYYPIVYNPEKSTKAAEQTVDEAAKRTMSGAQVLGTGRGFTNARSEAKNIARPLALQLDVVSSHVDQVIHNISFRIACRDVYRLTHDSRFQDAVISTLGRKTLDSIQKWAVDCWRVLPNNNGTAEGFFNKVLAGLRSNAGFAIMGFNMWATVENITNIFPMMDQVGAKNALMSISDFYTDLKKNRELINLSPFMRERADSMDRDIRSVKAPFEGSGPISGWLKQYAYFPLVLTDRMLSEPLWCRVYKASIEKNFIAVHEENQRQLARFRIAQEKAQELRGQMADLVAERAKLRNSLQEDEENDAPYTPDALRHITAAKIRIAEIERALEPMNKELWAAERDIDLLENIEVKSQNDILEEAKELSVRDADAAVRNAFGSGKTKDLAPALREKSELMKMFTVFISYFNTQMNAIALSYYGGKFAREDLTGLQNLGRWMPLIRSLMYRIFLTALVGSLLKMALTGDGGDEKHKYRKVKDAEGNERTEEIPLLERFLVQFGKNLVSTATGSLIGIREITAVLNNLVFEGTDYGRGVGGSPIAVACADKVLKAFKLAMAKADKDAEIEESERKKKEKYAKMTPAARKKFDEEQKYKKPPKRINYIDVFKEFGDAVVSATAARTGVTNTIANTVLTSLQYMLDGDGRYDATWENVLWSAFWNKKPVEREVPKKPEEPKKKKKGAKK